MKVQDRIKELRRVKARDLQPNKKKRRTHPQAQRDALKGVLAEIGYADALLARELRGGKLELIDGHLRAETTPDTEVPVLVLDLTAKEADKLLATLDPLAAMAEANKQALGELLAGIESDNEGVEKMLGELAAGEGIDLFESGAETPDPEPQIDRADELLKKWKVELGQLWEIPGRAGTHRVLCGDCETRCPWPGVAAMLVTDPPYGVSYVGKTKDALTIANDDCSEKELAARIVKWFDWGEVVSRPGAYWFATVPPGPLHLLFAGDWKRRGILRQIMVWRKDSMVLGHSEYHYQHEPILFGWTNGDRLKNPDRTRTTMWEVDRPKASREHPTMKPTALFGRAIQNHTRGGDIVADPFLGSGTTLIAAEQLGRVCYGVEIAPKYVAVILQRAVDADLTPRLTDG